MQVTPGHILALALESSTFEAIVGMHLKVPSINRQIKLGIIPFTCGADKFFLDP
ncbi:hypothetical protein GCM10007159_37730 [Modicisalibacter luteus]|nr:hypothetical protein GCM10007159_37730 [Halomonas lutea]